METKNLGIEPLKELHVRKSMGQHVFENLKQAIILGEIAPGQRLVETHIADTLDISRTPVREAIHKLELEGYLQKLPRGGYAVLGMSREDIEETFGIRSVLESYAARLAAIKHKKEELGPLETKAEEYLMCLNRGEMDALPKINTEFHELLYALSRSPKLEKMINNLKDQIYRFRQIILRNKKMAKKSHKDHKLMIESIKKRDADGVEKLVREHILRGQGVVLQEWDSTSNIDDKG